MIVRNRAYLDERGAPSLQLLQSVCAEHQRELPRLKRLGDYYNVKHAIDSRQRSAGLPNTRIANDLPGYIVRITSGYLVGQPVSYADRRQQQAIDALLDTYKRSNADSLDAEVAVDAAVYGRGVVICYANAQAQPRMAQLDPKAAFVVYDDTVEHAPMFGVHIVPEYDEMGLQANVTVTVYTDALAISYRGTGFVGLIPERETPHHFGGVPIVEFWNNAGEKGDFENVLGMIDAYDELQSDRVNDKAQFVDSILVMQGVMGFAPLPEADLGGGDSQGGEGQEAPRSFADRLREDKVLAMPEGSDVKWLDHQLDESSVEVLRKSLLDDIHKYAMVPDLTDEHFASNASGVAMKYKLFGLEQLTKVKERWFTEGLRQRLRLMANFLAIQGGPRLDADSVTITFTRALPSNEVEIAQTVTTLQGLVPDEILLAQIPFIDDVGQAMDMLVQQKAEAAKAQREAFNPYPDANGEEEADEA